MIIQRGETRSLLSWLINQERVMRLWIDEFGAAATLDADFVRRLEEHHDWLVCRIDELTRQVA